jgi:hypothetical protein
MVMTFGLLSMVSLVTGATLFYIADRLEIVRALQQTVSWIFR